MKRETTQIIWRTVVFAGAMLGSPGCGKSKPAATTPPSNTQTEPAKKPEDTTTVAKPDPTTTPTDPCAGQDRPRGTDDDGGGGVGRGFVLS
jgi:hypothetical protein